MQIIKNSRLTGRQISDIDHLIQECRAFSPIRLSFPFEEGSVFYLAYERKDGADMLVSVLALIIPNMDDSDETFECLAFTRPSCRRKGYFSALFEAAEELFEDANLLIPCDGQDEAVLPVLHSLGAELDSCEYKMERTLTENDLPDMSAAGAQSGQRRFHRLFFLPFPREFPARSSLQDGLFRQQNLLLWFSG